MAPLSRPVVLAVEDDPDIQECYSIFFARRVELLQARCVEEALQFLQTRTPQLILMDGDVPSQGISTDQLVRRLRRLAFHGPIIAISHRDDLQRALVRAGCDYTSGKAQAPALVFQLLGLS